LALWDVLELLIDVQQASVKPPEAPTDLVIGELPSVHFQKVPRGSGA
jgi:hypothetical protein